MTSTESEGSDGAPVEGPVLLVCDDSQTERSALATILRRNGYNVEEAADGQSAMQHMKERKVDLLILDLQMPNVDGFKVLDYVQEHRQALPVILLSGLPPEKIQHKMHTMKHPELPALLIKPIEVDQLIQLIDLHLSGGLPDLTPES